jgi:hypothetical protein
MSRLATCVVVIDVHFALAEVISAQVASAILRLPHPCPVLNDEWAMPGLRLIAARTHGTHLAAGLIQGAALFHEPVAVALVPFALRAR